ncbi:hypothetical protein Misp01_30960 [Microtetraspora sp. NBRC 13810]|uniref:hypothetical protein n=1 Tax=Microtetraspora sp. NBRC 13810 TaxID=3030990 RepID=UPI0024A583CE|nr:hypothetical protein [Microtetraspora sp. NBRC 13810]GLW07966.1 hypothetical protein Misp01_30960 [Microtetraspora sp. NBRC 13810]
MRDILDVIDRAGYSVERTATERLSPAEGARGAPTIEVRVALRGPHPMSGLLATLSGHPGVLIVDTGDIDASD